MQRSLVGLLQSLLFQMLKQHRHLVSQAFPAQEWLIGGSDFQFSKVSLENALKSVLDAYNSSDICVFILIDGLDEFNEQDSDDELLVDESKLVHFLQQFYERPTVKLCVASRPYMLFRTEFAKGCDRSFRIQDLTWPDIATYVCETMDAHKTFGTLARDDQDYRKLIDEIIDMRLIEAELNEKGKC